MLVNEADDSPPSSSRLNNAWSYTSVPSYICLPGVHRYKFTVTFSTVKKKPMNLPIQRHMCCLYIERTSGHRDLERSKHLFVLSLHNFEFT